ncbi:hypothetical protein G6F40_014431 [Rhizopus arrhizus]|nr:hypothetical protein G6F40_014431 [Rhizopus arrhizus]
MPPRIQRDQARGSQQRRRQVHAAGCCQITRPPLRIELRLEAAQATEAIQAFAVPRQQAGQPDPAAREPMLGQSGQRRHAQREARVALRAAPQAQFDEKVVHRALGRLVDMAHQVHRQLGAGRCLPQVGERHDLAFGLAQCARAARQVIRVVAAQREALFIAGLVVQPGVGDGMQAWQQAGNLFHGCHPE